MEMPFLILMPIAMALFGVISAATAGSLALFGLGVMTLMFVNNEFSRARRL
jgi:hypothetical protein